MMYSITQFENLCITNKDETKKNNLEHIKILSNLKSRVKLRNMPNIQNATLKNSNGKSTLPIPQFDEIRKVSNRYRIIYDNNVIKVQDSVTNEIVKSKDIEEMAVFCNLWLSSAGVKLNNDNGENYAFNDGAKELYNYFIKSIKYK